MVSSISGSMNSSAMMSGSAMMRPPEEKNAFQISDSDANGLVSETELEALLTEVADITGTTVTASDAMNSYDTDSDNNLSGEEMLEMLSSMGFSPPEMQAGEGEQAGGPPPPPPPSTSDAMSAYSQNSGDDLMTQLMEALTDNTDSDSEGTSISAFT
jgi:hypothetical protein